MVDCQATAAAPRGHLLEIGWARVLGTTITHAHASLIALPDGEQIPPAVARITGISEHMMRSGCRRTLRLARADRPGRESHAAARADGHPLRSIRAAVPSHVGRRRVSARRGLHAGYRQAPSAQFASVQPARPRWILRSRGWCAPSKRRSRRSDSVRLARVGRPARQARRVDLGRAPRLARRTCKPIRRRRRIWPMPRDVRLSLPTAPGIYRMLRTDGSVLYIGKAASLHHRVNSYFRKQAGVPERLLEMLSQARAISFDVTPSPLEAALLEPDEIKRHRPPYNVALTTARPRVVVHVAGSQRA